MCLADIAYWHRTDRLVLHQTAHLHSLETLQNGPLQQIHRYLHQPLNLWTLSSFCEAKWHLRYETEAWQAAPDQGSEERKSKEVASDQWMMKHVPANCLFWPWEVSKLQVRKEILKLGNFQSSSPVLSRVHTRVRDLIYFQTLMPWNLCLQKFMMGNTVHRDTLGMMVRCKGRVKKNSSARSRILIILWKQHVEGTSREVEQGENLWSTNQQELPY